MTKRLFFAGAIVISILFLIALVPYMQDPGIYQKTPAEFSTRYHNDPGIYEKTDLNASGTSLLLMQNLLDITGPITQNIKLNDSESAQMDLAKYKDLVDRNDELVIQIQMNETELDEYRSIHEMNLEILSDFLNQTTDLEQLKHLEIQFKYPGKTGDLTSLVFEESAIRKRMNQLYEQYRQSEVIVNKTATKYGLDDTQYQESLKNIAEIVQKENQDQIKNEQQAVQSFDVLSANSTTSLSAFVAEGSPDVAVFGQVLTGEQVPVQDAQVMLFWNEGYNSTDITDAGAVFIHIHLVPYMQNPGYQNATIIDYYVVPYMQNPELYQKILDKFSTRYHSDPGIFNKIDLDASGSNLILMQEILNITDPITLNIRANDSVSAQENLDENRSTPKKNQEIQLDSLNQTTNQEPIKHLEVLQSDSLQTTNLEPLKHLEIQFEDPTKTGDFISPVFGDSAIQERMNPLTEQYQQSEVVVNSTTTKYGLNDIAYQELLLNVAEIIRKSNQDHARIDQGEYGDTLHFTGDVRNNRVSDLNQSVRIFIEDGGDWESKPDANGSYSLNYTIGNISRGRHNASSSYGGMVSTKQSFDVLPVNSTTSLSAVVAEGSPDVVLSGQVLTGGHIPVHDAPVMLVLGDGNNTTVITDVDGAFRTVVPLSKGDYTAQAFFAGEGYPINASHSELVSVTGPGHISPISIIAIVVIMALSLGAAAFYLRRKRTEPEKIPDAPGYQNLEDEKIPRAEEDPKRPTEDIADPFFTSPMNFDQWVAESGLRGAAYQVYLTVLAWIKKDISIPVDPSWTPREVALRCQDRHYSHSFLKFIRIFEKFRYGPGPFSEEEIEQFIDETTAIIRLIGRDKRD